MTDGPTADLVTGRSAAQIDPDYNPTFEELVDRADDTILGLIAYGYYKIAKREWASRIRAQIGRAPTDEELKAYIATWTPSQLQGVRERAAQVMAEYANNVIAAERPRILREALRGSFWRAVWPSMLASAFYTIALIMLVVIAARAGVDLLGIIEAAATR
jgi:hypothetical protein